MAAAPTPTSACRPATSRSPRSPEVATCSAPRGNRILLGVSVDALRFFGLRCLPQDAHALWTGWPNVRMHPQDREMNDRSAMADIGTCRYADLLLNTILDLLTFTIPRQLHLDARPWHGGGPIAGITYFATSACLGQSRLVETPAMSWIARARHVRAIIAPCLTLRSTRESGMRCRGKNGGSRIRVGRVRTRAVVSCLLTTWRPDGGVWQSG